MELLYIIAALIAGLVVGFFVGRSRGARLETEIGVLRSKMEDLKNSAERELEQERASARSLLESREKSFDDILSRSEDNHRRILEERSAAFESALRDKEEAYVKIIREKERAHAEAMERQREHDRDSLEALQGRFDETVAKMKAELETVTADLLKRRQAEFETASRENVGKILEPLNDNIRQMREAVDKNTMRHSEMGGQLSTNIRLVMEHSDAARKSAERLADALRGGGRIQGDWGETVLTELLQSQGLEEGVHFDTQATLRDAAGNAVIGERDRRMRPDVILHLDKEREVIIDAKVSLSAYLDYMNAETEEVRAQSLRNHIQSVENHVNELARKDYTSYVHPPKVRMNYVIMFVPNTSALYAAVSGKPDLWRKAMEKNVYIADEQTLYAALRIIDMTWKQIAQAENHEKVYSLANEMLDRVSVFFERFSKIGKQLDDARKSYDDALLKLKDSGKSIPQTCRKLVSLGATVKPRKGVDPTLFDASAADAEEDAQSTRDNRQALS